jgi:methyl-accepting chemotaxis protein
VVSQIAVSGEEQARGVGNIGQSIMRIESVTQNNAANAHETATAVEMIEQVQTTRKHLEELVAWDQAMVSTSHFIRNRGCA